MLSYHLFCFMHTSVFRTAQTFKSVKNPNLLIVFSENKYLINLREKILYFVQIHNEAMVSVPLVHLSKEYMQIRTQCVFTDHRYLNKQHFTTYWQVLQNQHHEEALW